MNDTQVYIVNAFTDALFGGNPAAVVPVAFAMSDELMQSIAAQHNLSETAFPECLCLLYTSPSPRDGLLSRMPSSA